MLFDQSGPESHNATMKQEFARTYHHRFRSSLHCAQFRNHAAVARARRRYRCLTLALSNSAGVHCSLQLCDNSRGRVREKKVAIGHETVMPVLSPEVRYEGIAPPGEEFFVPRSPAFSANASRSNIRTEVPSKSKFNGVGGTQNYLSFTHLGGYSSQNIDRKETFNEHRS
jgi:hypothetical protein